MEKIEVKKDEITKTLLPNGKAVWACPACRKGYDSLEECSSHYKAHYSSGFKCTMCDYTNEEWYRIKVHMEIHNQIGTNKCEKCEQLFSSSSALYSHTRRIHAFGQKKCEKCEFIASCELDLIKHIMSMHDDKFICQYCSLSLDTKKELEGHLNDYHMGFTCKLCLPMKSDKKREEISPQKFSTQETIRKHIEDRHRGEKLYFCRMCNYTCKSSTNLKKHSYMHSSVKKYSCDRPGCQFQTKDHKNLKQHKITKHKKDDEYVCRDCCFVTKDPYQLEVHISLQHMKIFKCDQCSFESKNSSSVRRHKIAKHVAVEDMRYICTSCDYRTNVKISLQRHQLVHRKPQKKFKCLICNEVFDERELVENHLNQVHDNCNKTFNKDQILLCGDCTFMTTKQSSLTKHTTSHSSNKPFRCKECDYKGRTKFLLKSHTKHKHSNRPRATRDPKQVKITRVSS